MSRGTTVTIGGKEKAMYRITKQDRSHDAVYDDALYESVEEAVEQVEHDWLTGRFRERVHTEGAWAVEVEDSSGEVFERLMPCIGCGAPSRTGLCRACAARWYCERCFFYGIEAEGAHERRACHHASGTPDDPEGCPAFMENAEEDR